LEPPEPPNPPEPPDVLNFCLGGFGGLESCLGLLCSVDGTFSGGVYFVFWGFFTGFVSIFSGGVVCLTGSLSTFPGNVVGLFGCVLGGQGGGELGLHVVGGVTGLQLGLIEPGWQGGGVTGLQLGLIEPGWQGGGVTGLQLGLIEPGWQGGGVTGLQLGLIEPGWQGGSIGGITLPLFPSWLLLQSVTYVPCAVS